MPSALSFPGVYIEEVPSGVHTITGVATSIAAFIGYTAKGRDNIARRVLGFPDFERNFGGLAANSELSYAVSQFFDNGGGEAYVVRIPGKGAKPAEIKMLTGSGGTDALRVTALSTGSWASGMLVDVDLDGILPADDKTFNLTVTDPASGQSESFEGVTSDKAKGNFAGAVVNDEDNGSKLVTVDVLDNTKRPAPTGTIGAAIAVDADGKPTGIDAGKNMRVKVSIDRPGGIVVDRVVPVFNKGEVAPDSIAALCRQVERRVNAALAGMRA